jgi:hypothetical protein
MPNNDVYAMKIGSSKLEHNTELIWERKSAPKLVSLSDPNYSLL